MDKKEFETAKSRAMYLLTARAYTEKQIGEKLTKNYSPETVKLTLNWLIEREFIDDRKYAENRLRYLRESKKYGSLRIKNELKRKGVPDDIIADVMADDKERDYVAAIVERISKKHLDKLGTREGEAKIFASMARYGFLYGDVKKAISQIKNSRDFVC
jgi:regulatory protein